MLKETQVKIKKLITIEKVAAACDDSFVINPFGKTKKIMHLGNN